MVRPAGARYNPRYSGEPGDDAALARAVLELLYGSGLRVGEVCGLTVGRVDFARGRISVFGKGSKERDLPLSDFARDAIDAYVQAGRPVLAAEDSDALFFNRRHKPMTTRDARAMVERYRKRVIASNAVAIAQCVRRTQGSTCGGRNHGFGWARLCSAVMIDCESVVLMLVSSRCRDVSPV